MLALIRKDLLLEIRSKETVFSLFVLGVLILLVFNFALDITAENMGRLAPGLLWAAIVLSAMLGVSRTFLIERENGCMSALLASPLDRSSLFVAKLCVNLLFLLTFEAMLLPVFMLMFGLDPWQNIPALAVVLFAGSVGLAATGTLFALAALGTRARELMLPLLVLPLEIPLVIAAVKATALVLAGQPLGLLGAWGNILVAFDVLFLVLGWLAFEFVATD
ncbi:MAG: heme exporter protein CcmB [Deltaproteobacteria bacterium]